MVGRVTCNVTRTPGVTPEDPDQELVQLARSGDATAFSELIQRHEVALRRVVLGIVADAHLAEDVLQDVFFIAYRRLDSFRGEARLGTWLYRVAVREALRMQRRWTTLARRFFPLGDRDASLLVGRDTVHHRSELEEVLTLLNRLPARQRAAFVLHVVEGKSYQEISSILESCPGTVGSWIHRARARLNREMEQRENRGCAINWAVLKVEQ